MVKSEYRREMILLRPLEEGISGFCRLEAHIMRGSITYNIRAQRNFGGRLVAVLVGRRNGRWQAALGGEIRADALGQAGYYWDLDPRSINSLALENYALVGVAVDGPEARLLLAGKQDRGGAVDWEAAERAVRELLAPPAAGATQATGQAAEQAAAPDEATSQATVVPDGAPAEQAASDEARSAETRSSDVATQSATGAASADAAASSGASDEMPAQAQPAAPGATQSAPAAECDDPCRGLRPCAEADAPAADGAVTNAADAAEQPATVEQTATPEQPAAVAQPAEAEQPAAVAQPAEAEQPAAMEQPATVAQPTAPEPASTGESTSASGSTAAPVPTGASGEPARSPDYPFDVPGWEHGARYIPIAEEQAAEEQTAEQQSARQSTAAQPGTASDAVRARDIRVLGAAITGEKDTDLSDAQLEQLIERTVRGMMARITGADCDAGRASEATPAPAESAPAASEPAESALATGEPAASDAAQIQSEPAPTGSSSARADAEPDAAEPIQAWLLEGVCAPDRAWPECCAELKRLFANARRVYPLELPGYVFVRAPLAEGGSCAVGVKCEDGRPSEVAYLIPGRYAAQPPAGLEGYEWREGLGGGFWVARQDAFTGNMLFG